MRMKPRNNASACAMRRIEYVRLVFDDDGTRAEVVGVAFRLPTTHRVPLGYAAELISRGTPLVTRYTQTSRVVTAEGR
jgi:hypothetical protein